MVTFIIGLVVGAVAGGIASFLVFRKNKKAAAVADTLVSQAGSVIASAEKKL